MPLYRFRFEDTERNCRGPLTELALEAFQDQIRISRTGIWLVPSDENPSGPRRR